MLHNYKSTTINKIGTEVAHVTRDSDTIFKVKGQLLADVLEQMEQKNEQYKSHLIHMRDNCYNASAAIGWRH